MDNLKMHEIIQHALTEEFLRHGLRFHELYAILEWLDDALGVKEEE